MCLYCSSGHNIYKLHICYPIVIYNVGNFSSINWWFNKSKFLVTQKFVYSISNRFPCHFCMWNFRRFIYFSLCFNFFHLLAQRPNLEIFSIYSNKFFHNFYLSESSLTWPWLPWVRLIFYSISVQYRSWWQSVPLTHILYRISKHCCQVWF